MDKSDYKNLLKESSINDETKFKLASAEIPKTTEAFSSSTREREGIINHCCKKNSFQRYC